MWGKMEFTRLDFKINKRYRENGTPNNRARPGRRPKLSPSDKQYLKYLVFIFHSFFRSEKIYRCFCPSFHCEKTNQHYESERRCSCQEAVTEKWK